MDTFYVVGYILIGILAAFGALLALVPKIGVHSYQRDDPSELSKVRKAGLGMIGFAAFGAALITKHRLF